MSANLAPTWRDFNCSVGSPDLVFPEIHDRFTTVVEFYPGVWKLIQVISEAIYVGLHKLIDNQLTVALIGTKERNDDGNPYLDVGIHVVPSAYLFLYGGLCFIQDICRVLQRWLSCQVSDR